MDTHLESQYPPDSRYDEVEKILSFIKSGNSCQIISLPGVGRSNILRLIAYNRECRRLHLEDDQTKYHFVLMNFSEMKGKELKEVIKYIFLEIVDSLSDRKFETEYKAVKKLFDESLKTGDETVFFQGLKKTIDYLCLEKGLNLILLFDRFQDCVPWVDSRFFDNLRVLRDRAKLKFSVVIPLSRPLEETVEPEIISSFYEFIVGNYVYLSLGDQKIMDFRKKYLEGTTDKEIDQKVNEKAIEVSGGLGKLWLVCFEALSKDETITNLINNSRVNAVLTEIWNSLTPHEQSLLKENRGFESPHLIAVGLVKNNQLTVPILEEFASNQPREKFDLGQISDELTSSEYKLLKFMTENPGKVLERNEIVNSVWGDLASTSGVTEQALDQLIFRLRKKIEENPNSPQHIKTVKGRGFSFEA